LGTGVLEKYRGSVIVQGYSSFTGVQDYYGGRHYTVVYVYRCGGIGEHVLYPRDWDIGVVHEYRGAGVVLRNRDTGLVNRGLGVMQVYKCSAG